MEEEIKQFKQANGNVNYTVKELMQGLHTKIDQINDRLVDGDKLLSSHSSWITAFKLILMGICVTLGYIIFG